MDEKLKEKKKDNQNNMEDGRVRGTVKASKKKLHMALAY